MKVSTYLPDLSLDFHLFRTLNDRLLGQQFLENYAVIGVMKKWVVTTRQINPTPVQQAGSLLMEMQTGNGGENVGGGQSFRS